MGRNPASCSSSIISTTSNSEATAARRDSEMSPFWILVHAHDHIWRDKTQPLRLRIQACTVLWEIALGVYDERTDS
jgi:hypothetical protein